MKNLFYCTKIDSKGNQLTSSYTTEKGVSQYGKGCDVEESLMFADLSDSTKLGIKTENFDGPIIRSLLKNNKNVLVETQLHSYQIWGKKAGVWNYTGNSFPSYSAANSLMKSLIDSYTVMAVLYFKDNDGEEVIAESEITSLYDL